MLSQIRQSGFPTAAPFLFFVLTLPLLGQGERILGTNELRHLDLALSEMNIARADLGFDKDHAEPRLVLPRVRALLEAPLLLPPYGDRVMAFVQRDAIPALMRDALELKDVSLVVNKKVTSGLAREGFDPKLNESVSRLLSQLASVNTSIETAFSTLTRTEREYVAAAAISGIWDEDLTEGFRAAMSAAGIGASTLKRLDKEKNAVDPEPAADGGLDLVEKVDLALLVSAGLRAEEIVSDFVTSLAAVEEWPTAVLIIETGLGLVVIGTEGNDRYHDAALLVVDPAGDDDYEQDVGAANGLQGRMISVVVDLAGSDRYRSDSLLGAGAALQGVSVVVDCAGDDDYRAAWCGQGAALQGVAVLRDLAGNDTYQAHALAQGAAIVGAAWLEDVAGSDRYDVGFYGQGCSGVWGAGVLVDRAGSDVYLAGGRFEDRGRHDGRMLSLSQGFSIGNRPFSGGGVAALVDLAGNDTYKADIFGQGVSYYYAIGLLLDRAGNDHYAMHHYGQGTGIHLSVGLLADSGGNDTYSGYILSQGSAHDFSVGMLLDRGGDDTYTADHHSQGRALNNGFGLLMDSRGNDAYFGRQSEQCQGVGNNAGTREYGSLGILCDLDGSDRYSSGATDGARWLRPLYGIVYDFSEAQP